MPRPDGRTPEELRPFLLERNASPFAEGSCLVRTGDTLVLCTASVETSVPAMEAGDRIWLAHSGIRHASASNVAAHP